MAVKRGIKRALQTAGQGTQNDVLGFTGLPRRSRADADGLVKSVDSKQGGFLEQYHPFYPRGPNIGAVDALRDLGISAIDVLSGLVRGPASQNVGLRRRHEFDAARQKPWGIPAVVVRKDNQLTFAGSPSRVAPATYAANA